VKTPSNDTLANVIKNLPGKYRPNISNGMLACGEATTQ